MYVRHDHESLGSPPSPAVINTDSDGKLIIIIRKFLNFGVSGSKLEILSTDVWLSIGSKLEILSADVWLSIGSKLEILSTDVWLSRSVWD